MSKPDKNESIEDTISAPEASNLLSAETVAWSFIDHHQADTGLHAALTDLVRRARVDGTATPEAGEAKPVAWRYRRKDIPEMDWRYSDDDMSENSAYVCEPLYAAHVSADAGLGMSREEIAAFLLARAEEDIAVPVSDHLLDWARICLRHGAGAIHSGDCTKESHSCSRCLHDRLMAHADQLIALMPSETGHVTTG